MNCEDGQVCLCTVVFLFYKVQPCSQNINKQNVNIADETQITTFSVGITILNQRIILKDDIEFVSKFQCLLGHHVFEL